jgi:hypothetical protein
MHPDSIQTPSKTHATTLVVADDQGAFHEVPVASDRPTGAEILVAAGHPASPDHVVLQLLAAGGIESIRLDERADLGLGRKFVLSKGDRLFRFIVDAKPFEWPHKRVSALTVRELAQVPENRELEQRRGADTIVLGAHDVIDLGPSGVEEFVTKARTWKLKVQGVVLDYDHPEVKVGQAMQRAGFDPNKAWHIFLLVMGQPKQEVTIDYVIDLRTPGIEKIRLMQRNVDNGEGQQPVLRKALPLLSADVAFLDSLGLPWETAMVESRRWLLIHEYSLPNGYTPQKTTLALDMPADYPASQVDMFYFAPWVARTDGVVIPSIQVRATIDGVEFQGWSRHRNAAGPWDPATDNVCTHLTLVETCLVKELGE